MGCVVKAYLTESLLSTVEYMTADEERHEFVLCIYCNLIVAEHRIWNMA